MTNENRVKKLNGMIEQLNERIEIAETQKGYFQYCADKLEKESKEQAQLLVEIDKLEKHIDLDAKTIEQIKEYKLTLEA